MSQLIPIDEVFSPLDWLFMEASGMADADVDRVMWRFKYYHVADVQPQVEVDMIDRVYDTCLRYHVRRLKSQLYRGGALCH